MREGDGVKPERERSVAALWRFPVKSMAGEPLEEALVSKGGILGDRAFALIDVETGRVVSAKSVRRFPGVLHCRAGYVGPPREGRDLPPVRIALPGGAMVTSDSGDANRVLSAHFRREVRLARSAPADFTIDMYHPDIEGAAPADRRDTVAPQRLGSALFAELGVPSPVPDGAFFDCFPVSVLTTATLASLAALRPESRFDARRFRMNVIVGTAEEGFPENGWIGRTLAVGGDVRVRVTAPDSRCVMTTLAQDDLPGDPEVLRTLVRHNRIPAGGGGPSPCAGVYAVVEEGGMIRRGDRVALAAAPGPAAEVR